MFRRLKALVMAFVLVVAAALSLNAAWAVGGEFACVLQDGTNVPILMDKNLNNIAVARNDKTSGRTIVVNPDALGVFHLATRWFWLAHECAHHQLGHTVGQYSATIEQDADCYGIRQLVKNDQIDIADLQVIRDDVSQVGGNDKNYPTGEERAKRIVACALTQPN